LFDAMPLFVLMCDGGVPS